MIFSIQSAEEKSIISTVSSGVFLSYFGTITKPIIEMMAITKRIARILN